MSSEELGKIINDKAGIAKAVLNTRYGGWIAAGVAIVWALGNMTAEQLEQAAMLLGHINNNIGVGIVIFIILVFINACFFKPYLTQQIKYATAITSFEASLDGKMEDVVGKLRHLIDDNRVHQDESRRIIKIVEERAIPALEKMLERMEQ
jgi:hypothetical protein